MITQPAARSTDPVKNREHDETRNPQIDRPPGPAETAPEQIVRTRGGRVWFWIVVVALTAAAWHYRPHWLPWIAPFLPNVQHLFCEYHHDAGHGENRLAGILILLENAGFQIHLAKSFAYQSLTGHHPMKYVESPYSLEIWAKNRNWREPIPVTEDIDAAPADVK